MNKRENLTDKLTKRIEISETVLNIVTKLNQESVDSIRFISDDSGIFFKTDSDHKTIISEIKKILKVKTANRIRVYESYGELAIVYSVGKIELLFYFSDFEESIKKHLGRHCRAKKTERTEIDYDIVCSVAGVIK